MSKIVIHNGTVYLCGQVGNRGESIEAQCAEAFRRIDGLLAEAGTSNERMLQVIVWLKTMDDFDAMNRAYECSALMLWAPCPSAVHANEQISGVFRRLCLLHTSCQRTELDISQALSHSHDRLSYLRHFPAACSFL
jgi:hypothetical protein